MDSQYLMRKALLTDLETLVRFTEQEAKETEGAAPDPDAMRNGVKSGLDGSAPSTHWVAQTESGVVVGAISVVTEWSNFRGGYYWWVQSLYIVTEHRGTGLVDSLLSAVAETARTAGALDLRLHVLRSNQRAVSAYERCGFEVAPYAIMTRKLD